jgi:hypothetical protein
VGLAIYLPSSVITPVIIGAVAGWVFDRVVEHKPGGDTAKRLGVLVMSGFIVGESLFNVALAGLIVLSGKGEPLAIANSLSEGQGMWIALVLGVALVGGLYRWSARNGRKVAV